jgi:hypothetical protein
LQRLDISQGRVLTGASWQPLPSGRFGGQWFCRRHWQTWPLHWSCGLPVAVESAAIAGVANHANSTVAATNRRRDMDRVSVAILKIPFNMFGGRYSSWSGFSWLVRAAMRAPWRLREIDAPREIEHLEPQRPRASLHVTEV